MGHHDSAYIINVEGGTGHPIITPSESVGNSTAGDKLSTLTHYHLIIMWDEIMDMPGEIFDMDDGSFMTDEDVAIGQRLLDSDMSLTFDVNHFGVVALPINVILDCGNHLLFDLTHESEVKGLGLRVYHQQ